MATDIILRRFDNDDSEINLSESEMVDDKVNGRFLVSFYRMEFDFEAFYKTNFCIECAHCNKETESAFKKVFMDQTDQMTIYTAYVFKHQMLFLALRDVMRGTPSPFSLCLPSYLKSLSSLSLFDAEVFEAIFSQVFITAFGKKLDVGTKVDPEHPFTKLTERNHRKLARLCRFVVILIEGDVAVPSIIRKVVGLYRPSFHALLFVYKFAESVRNIYDDGAAFRFLSDLFRDTWLYRCFSDDVTKLDFIYMSNFMDMFPYLGITFGMEQILKSPENNTNLLEYYMGQSPALRTLRLTKAIARPFFRYLYQQIQKDEIVPVLNMSQENLNSITEAYTKHKEILTKAFSFSESAQMTALNVLVKMWEAHGFEPKGFMYANVSLMANNGIYQEVLLSKWVKESAVAASCIEALMLELNCLVFSVSQGRANPAIGDHP